MPGVSNPWTNLHAASAGRFGAVAVIAVTTAKAVMEPTIIRLRSNCSPKIANKAAEMATPSVGALTVKLTLASDA